MKSILLSIALSLFSISLISCASSTGSSNSRSLGHTYQDSSGLTFISLFDMGSIARGTARTIGDGSAPKNLSVSLVEFDRLWSQLGLVDLSSYAVTSDSQRFDTVNNYVIMKGSMPVGKSSTYVIPKSKAPASVKAWVRTFRKISKS